MNWLRATDITVSETYSRTPWSAREQGASDGRTKHHESGRCVARPWVSTGSQCLPRDLRPELVEPV